MRVKAAVAALWLCAVSAQWPAPVLGGEVAAVLSRSSGHYMEAFRAFSKAYNGTIDVYDLSKGEAPSEAAVVVAFGGRAATYDRYPRTAALVYCMAPGVDRQGGRRVDMVPEASAALKAMLALQPGLKRLALLWSSQVYAGYAGLAKEAGRGAGVELVLSPVESGDKLPAVLRRLTGAADAIWLLPDPALVTEENFTMLRDFSRGGRLPLYVPTEGLARSGGTAAIYAGFGDMGRAAAEAVSGAAAGPVVYPDKASVYVNREEAARLGLKDVPGGARGR
ncbi:MAG: hypothetical protein PHV33_09830 [Elusimicrobiales bacterium]|nr:hypothetical protein [Elusimicrobiales bacterium]